MKQKSICIIGSYNVGLFIKGKHLPAKGETIIGDTFYEGAGGKGSNQAICAARLGSEVSFICRIGCDKYGVDALKMYRQENIDTKYILVDTSTHTGISFVLIDEKGLNAISVAPGANYNLSPEDIDIYRNVIARSSILAVQMENRIETVIYAIKLAKELGVTTLLDPAPAQRLPDNIYPAIDIIKPNQTEAEILTGRSVKSIQDAKSAAIFFLDRGVRNVLLTLGEKGLIYGTGGVCTYIPAPKVNVVDTTGAGDAFIGGLLNALARDEVMVRAIEFASWVAALSVKRLGVVNAFPTIEEVNSSFHYPS